mmetsp:Transcript_30601/g.29510  ORF Transcript_30601/g.29510 Transcript_30601/m.29510 type:complete len:246 (-) Transcript_30601:208-945(-)
MDSTSVGTLFAEGLGYLVGAGSLLYYTPIAVRLVRQGSADGLTISTWWLKLASYMCSNIYAFTHEYALSTYIDSLIITAEALVILCLTAKYQKLWNYKFQLGLGIYGFVTTFMVMFAPSKLIAFGQGSSSILNVAALVPQFAQNANKKTAGDYSPITASLGSIGCAIRLFTTVQLTGSDPLLLGSFGLFFVVNSALLLQILYYGVIVEEKSFKSVMCADLKTPPIVEQSDKEDSNLFDLSAIMIS